MRAPVSADDLRPASRLSVDDLRRFAELFGGEPSHVAVAPGRVNLIGEHIDYCGLPVLPIAIERSVRILFRPREDGRVRIASELVGAGAREFEVAPEIEPFAPGDWGNYAKATARAVARGYGPDLRGLEALVLSDLPVASGLGSSSAFVVACALALLARNGLEPDRRGLAARLAAGERFVGTAGGGMDQAVCLLGREGHALRIAFDPLRTAPVPVPAAWRFVVAHSLERAEKSGDAREVYNLRTRECAEALRVLMRPGGAAGEAISGESADAADPTLGAARGPAGRAPPRPDVVPRATYPRLLATLGPSELISRTAELPPPLDRRFRHVVSEASRVDEAERALRDGDMEVFGAVLLEGHRSLRHDYGVSTPALDRLVELAIEAGAAGARLTGAGLGGCIVAVCAADHEASLLANLEKAFYGHRRFEGRLEDRLFAVRPSPAARVEPLSAP